MHAQNTRSTWNERPRWKRLAVLSAATLLLHAGLLGGVGWVSPAGEPVVAKTIHVRTIERPVIEPAPALATPQSGPVAPSAPVATPTPDHAPPRRPVVKPVTHAAAQAKPTPAMAEVAAGAEAPEPAAPLQLAQADTAPTAPPSATDDEPVPVYRTRPPPAATLRYRMQRGGLKGTGDLAWRPAGDRYELRLDGKLMGLTILTQSSQGGFDSAGLAPNRFTDQRARREVVAANFQREAGKITFSGPSDEFPAWPGVQDRLSWMIQLSSIVAANPRLGAPGSRVSMHVVGARADASVWVLRSVEREPVDTAEGAVKAIRFVREPRGPHDSGAEVWLDPQRHYLPIRAALRSGSESDALELELQEIVAP